MDRRAAIVSASAFALATSLRTSAATREPILGGPCEGCEWVFDDLPKTLGSRARIAPQDQPGAPMTIEGVVLSSRDTPAANVIVYAYHTNAEGIYPPAGNRHGTLRGWARTDAEGRYRFDTIRPGAYPGREVPEHVHMHVIEPGIGTYFIQNLEFLDDPLQTTRPREGRGGNGLVRPALRDGVWHARRDIALGRNIHDYPTQR
jgi:protocatechuate 3,4-dioxygenase beta subunit